MSALTASNLNEGMLWTLVTVFPSGTRHFLLIRSEGDLTFEAVHPLELLGLDRTRHFLDRFKEQQPALALVLALCRLLVRCL